MTETAFRNTESVAGSTQVIDLQALIEQRKALVRQREEAEERLRDLSGHEAKIIEQLRQQARDLYRSLGLTPEKVWHDLAKPATTTPSANAASNDEKRRRAKPGEVPPTHKWTNEAGETFYYNANGKGKRPAWIQTYHDKVVDAKNKVRIDLMQPYDEATDRAHWLTSVARAKKPVGGN